MIENEETFLKLCFNK